MGLRLAHGELQRHQTLAPVRSHSEYRQHRHAHHAARQTHLGFETIPTDEWGANSAWQLLCALTLNVVRQLQLTTIAPTRPNGRKRTYRHVLRSLRTLRFELLHVPARLVRPGGRPELRIAASGPARAMFSALLRALPAPT